MSNHQKVILALNDRIKKDLVVNCIKEKFSALEITSTPSSIIELKNVLKSSVANIIVVGLSLAKLDDMLKEIKEIVNLSGNAKILVMARQINNENLSFIVKSMTLGVNEFILAPDLNEKVMQEYFYAEFEKKISSIINEISRSSIKYEINNIQSNNPGEDFKLISKDIIKPKIIAIASSTGGPKALSYILKELVANNKIHQPIIITQHIPIGFSSHLAEQLTLCAGRKCVEGHDGIKLENDMIYLAPADYHMIFEKINNDIVIKLLKTDMVNFCRPSADPMFKSISKIYLHEVFAIVLTGMGADGLEGAKEIVKNGGAVIAQDKATSVVWGMPGVVARAGLCSAVLPIDEIPLYIEKIGV